MRSGATAELRAGSVGYLLERSSRTLGCRRRDVKPGSRRAPREGSGGAGRNGGGGLTRCKGRLADHVVDRQALLEPRNEPLDAAPAQGIGVLPNGGELDGRHPGNERAVVTHDREIARDVET